MKQQQDNMDDVEIRLYLMHWCYWEIPQGKSVHCGIGWIQVDLPNTIQWQSLFRRCYYYQGCTSRTSLYYTFLWSSTCCARGQCDSCCGLRDLKMHPLFARLHRFTAIDLLAFREKMVSLLMHFIASIHRRVLVLWCFFGCALLLSLYILVAYLVPSLRVMIAWFRYVWLSCFLETFAETPTII